MHKNNFRKRSKLSFVQVFKSRLHVIHQRVLFLPRHLLALVRVQEPALRSLSTITHVVIRNKLRASRLHLKSSSFIQKPKSNILIA